jgi:hypothetical protein
VPSGLFFVVYFEVCEWMEATRPINQSSKRPSFIHGRCRLQNVNPQTTQRMSARFLLQRKGAVTVEEEDAAELRLGPEFQNEHCLLFAEVKILLERLQQDADQIHAKARPYVLLCA